MWLKGSCHCGAVRFSARSRTPYPFNLCYCSICRKTAGGGGYAINLMAEAEGMQVEGEAHVANYQARLSPDAEPGPAQRNFCKRCGSALWVADPRWSQWIYPFASAIDTPLPRPPEHVHLMVEFAPGWVDVPKGEGHTNFPGYPEEAIFDWHEKRGLLDE